MEIVIITGLSGAGKSQALNVCEDMGYFSMDNLPPALFSKFVELTQGRDDLKKVAVVVDLRSRYFFNDLFKSLEELRSINIDYKIIFLEASEECIIRRYKEQRRPHPLSSDILEGYRKEKEITRHIRDKADYIIDTSTYKNQDIKNRIRAILQKEDNEILINITSFGYKNGIILDGDLVFDVRFLENPYYIKELKEKNGLCKETRDFVLSNERTKVFLDKLEDMLLFLIPCYKEEGKSIVVLGIGCTGGFHRSVAIAEEIAKRLEFHKYKVSLRHRDLK